MTSQSNLPLVQPEPPITQPQLSSVVDRKPPRRRSLIHRMLGSVAWYVLRVAVRMVARFVIR